MSSREKDPMDWWQKPEHLKDEMSRDNTSKSPKAKGSKGSKRAKKKPLTKFQLALLIIKNCIIIGILVALSAVAIHYVLRAITRHDLQCTVPQFQTLNMAEAQRVASINDLQLIINDSLYATASAPGEILDQLPEAGTIVKPGRAVYLTINATQQKMVQMPYVAGRSLRQAKNMLDIAGLTIERLIYEEDLATNYILEQSYGDVMIKSDSEMRVSIGSGVTLHVGVSEGRGETTVPNLIGSSIYVAKSALWDAGLNVGVITMEYNIDHTNIKLAQILTQGVEGDSSAQMGDEVSLTLTLDPSKVDSVRMMMRTVKLLEEQDNELEELFRLYEEDMADSLRRVGVDPAMEQESKPKKVERVEMEDLFN